MAAAYRVAAPSIRIVPWAALASCWPLPQQLLPVSATGGGRRRCTLAIISGKIILNFGFLKSLRTFQKPFFHGWGRKGKRQLLRLLPAEAAARRESFLLAEPLPSSPAAMPHSPFCRCATSSPGRGKSALKGTALVVAGNSAVATQRRPLGGAGCERSEQTEGVTA